MINLILQTFTEWFTAHGPRILGVLIAVAIATQMIHGFGRRTIRAYVEAMEKRRDRLEIDQRTETLSDVLNRATSLAAIVIIVILLLPEFGVNIGSFLAGAGIVGLAIGIGAQNLIRDVLAGLFIILEDQFGKGDRVRVAGVEGIVHDIHLRKTVLKDNKGAWIHIPNSEIKIVVNATKSKGTSHKIIK